MLDLVGLHTRLQEVGDELFDVGRLVRWKVQGKPVWAAKLVCFFAVDGVGLSSIDPTPNEGLEAFDSLKFRVFEPLVIGFRVCRAPGFGDFRVLGCRL